MTPITKALGLQQPKLVSPEMPPPAQTPSLSGAGPFAGLFRGGAGSIVGNAGGAGGLARKARTIKSSLIGGA